MAPVTVLTSIDPHPAPGETELRQRYLPAALVAGCRRAGPLGRGDVRARRPSRRPAALRGARPAATEDAHPVESDPDPGAVGGALERTAGAGARPRARAARRARGRASAGIRVLATVLSGGAERPAVPLDGLSPRGSLHLPAGGPGVDGCSLGRTARERAPGDPQGAQAGGGRGRPRPRSLLRRAVEDLHPPANPDAALAGGARAPGGGMRAPRGGRHALRTRRRRPGPRRGLGGVGQARRLLPAGGRENRNCATAVPAACWCGRRSCARAR